MPDRADRCTLRSEARAELLAGTASTIRRWLLVESAGPWGTDGLLDARLPGDVGRALRARGQRSHARVLLIRRPDRVADVDGSVTCFAVDAGGPAPWIGRRLLPTIEEAPALDPEDRDAFDPVDGPVAVVCTHGRRDVCCAERGRPLALATAEAFPASTWESTHVGGDRFAANLVLFPHALYFGRVDPAAGPAIVRDYAEGRIALDGFRGRATMPMVAQTADAHLRTRLGLRGIDDLVLDDVEIDGDASVVRLRSDGGRHVVRLRRTVGEPMRLTCHSTEEERPTSWEVVGIDDAEPASPAGVG